MNEHLNAGHVIHVPALILSCQLDRASAERLTGWRTRFFPPERNLLPAHLTLFHKLPGDELALVDAWCRRVTAERQASPLHFTGLRLHPGFVAVDVAAPELVAARRVLAAAFSAQLSPQDRQPWRSHVTLVNKTTAAAAAASAQVISSEFIAWSGLSLGLELSYYRGGPWELIATYPWCG